MNSKIKTHTATQLDQSYRLMQAPTVIYPTGQKQYCTPAHFSISAELDQSVSLSAVRCLLELLTLWSGLLITGLGGSCLLIISCLLLMCYWLCLRSNRPLQEKTYNADKDGWTITEQPLTFTDFFFFFFPQLLLVSSDVSRHIDCIVCGSICVYVLPLFLDISV